METKEQNIMLDFKKVPKGYQLCFNHECPKKDDCLRFMAGEDLPDNRDWGPAIYPNIKMDSEGCRLFDKGKPQMMAWGFNTLFSEVKHRHVNTLRTTLKQYLGGHSNYYRYHNGERLLNDKQQEWIINLFRRMGYTDNLQFDHQVTTFVFD
jgi:hypothetical protein